MSALIVLDVQSLYPSVRFRTDRPRVLGQPRQCTQRKLLPTENAAKDSKADLIVLGTHGESGFMKWLIGSVAESVLSHSEVDVLAVPPPRKA